MKVTNILVIAAMCFISAAQAAQPPSIKVQTPLARTMTYEVKWKSLNPLEFKPSLSFSNAQEQIQSLGLFAGGKLKLQVFSEQMWFLDNLNTEKFPPQDATLTRNSSGRFTVVFLNRGVFLSKKVVIASQRIQIVGKKYAAFETSLIDIPLKATDVHITLTSTIDISTGNPRPLSQTLKTSQPIRYVENSAVHHLRGLKNPNPKDENSAQFLLMESTPPQVGTSFLFEETHMYDHRWISMRENNNVAIRLKYEELVGKPYDPSLLRVRLAGYFYRTSPQEEWTFIGGGFRDIPAVFSTELEFGFFFSLSAQTPTGLIDLGNFYDSPIGDLSRGWKINLVK